MSRTSRNRPHIASSESPVALQGHAWLEAFLAPLTWVGADRAHKRINLFRLAGTLGQGLLAEADDRVGGRPGVYRHRTSIWVRAFMDRHGYLLELEVHSWDASTEASDTGDRQWLEVPRRQMYAERDRRTASVGEELDRLSTTDVPVDAIPAMLVGLAPGEVRHYAQIHVPFLLDRD